jgi:hypothetical protein
VGYPVGTRRRLRSAVNPHLETDPLLAEADGIAATIAEALNTGAR